MQPKRVSFWTYLGILFILVILLAYYQGLVQDVNAVGPFVIQAGEVAQGRIPTGTNAGQFAGYPTNPPTTTTTQHQ